jgi:hypothetical protein
MVEVVQPRRHGRRRGSKARQPISLLEPVSGYFGLILTWQDNEWKVRSLVFV